MFTPEATLGPFYPGAFALNEMPQDLSTVAPLLAHGPQGRPIRLSGRFLDSEGRPIPSLVVEFWQANANGRYRHPLDNSKGELDPQFDGFARVRTNDDGVFVFNTIMPGANGNRAPHLRLTIFASGIDRLVTQVFFEGEPLNDTDPVLNAIPDEWVRSRLVARKGLEGDYTIEVIMRGERETPFFDDWVR